jgi:hypothetical protein
MTAAETLVEIRAAKARLEHLETLALAAVHHAQERDRHAAEHVRLMAMLDGEPWLAPAREVTVTEQGDSRVEAQPTVSTAELAAANDGAEQALRTIGELSRQERMVMDRHHGARLIKRANGKKADPTSKTAKSQRLSPERRRARTRAETQQQAASAGSRVLAGIMTSCEGRDGGGEVVAANADKLRKIEKAIADLPISARTGQPTLPTLIESIVGILGQAKAGEVEAYLAAVGRTPDSQDPRYIAREMSTLTRLGSLVHEGDGVYGRKKPPVVDPDIPKGHRHAAVPDGPALAPGELTDDITDKDIEDIREMRAQEASVRVTMDEATKLIEDMLRTHTLAAE